MASSAVNVLFAAAPAASLITVVMLCLAGRRELQPERAGGTNLATTADASPWLSRCSVSDVIGIWVLVLLVIGGAIVAKKSIGQAAAVVVAGGC